MTGGDTGSLTCPAVGSNDPGLAEHRPGGPRPELLRPRGRSGQGGRAGPGLQITAACARSRYRGSEGRGWPSRIYRFWGSGDRAQAVCPWRRSGRTRSPLDRLPGADVDARSPAALNRSAEKGSLQGLTAGGCLEPPLNFSHEASPALFVRHRNIFCH